jgi:hypothetical protein
MLFSSGRVDTDFCREYSRMLTAATASKTIAAIAKYIARNLFEPRTAAALAASSDCDCRTIFGNSEFPTASP